jgi:hypothetical protein
MTVEQVERWNGGTVERRNGGTEERWSGGTEERSSTGDQIQVIPLFDSRTFAVIRVPASSNQNSAGMGGTIVNANCREFARMSANDKRKWERLILGVFACSRAFDIQNGSTCPWPVGTVSATSCESVQEPANQTEQINDRQRWSRTAFPRSPVPPFHRSTVPPFHRSTVPPPRARFMTACRGSHQRSGNHGRQATRPA